MWDRTGYSVGAVVFSVLGCGAGLDDGSAETLGSQSSAVFTTTCEGNDHVCEIDSSNASDHASPTIQGSIAWYFAKRGSGYTYELNPGIFGIGDKITVPPNAILRAPSTESVEIRPKAGSKFFDPDVKVAMIQLSDGSSLEKIHADGDGASVIGPVNIVDATLTKAAVIRVACFENRGGTRSPPTSPLGSASGTASSRLRASNRTKRRLRRTARLMASTASIASTSR
jgi:hypothetical protein